MAIQQDYPRSIVGVEEHGDSFLAYLGVIGHRSDIPILPELLKFLLLFHWYCCYGSIHEK